MKTVFAVIVLWHALSSSSKFSLDEKRVGTGGSLVEGCGGGKGDEGTESKEIEELHCDKVLKSMR